MVFIVCNSRVAYPQCLFCLLPLQKKAPSLSGKRSLVFFVSPAFSTPHHAELCRRHPFGRFSISARLRTMAILMDESCQLSLPPSAASRASALRSNPPEADQDEDVCPFSTFLLMLNSIQHLTGESRNDPLTPTGNPRLQPQ
jgi:hypothetical protein